MGHELRVTANVGKVLRVLLDDPTGDHYGYTLMRATGLPSGNLYPIVGRLEAAGWIEGRTEEIDPSAAGRRPRRYYRLTGEGVTRGRLALAHLRAALGDPSQFSPASPRVRPV